MTTLQLANLLGVQHELVRDAAGSLQLPRGAKITTEQAMTIRVKLVSWGKLPVGYDNTK